MVSNLYPFGADTASFEHGATRAEELIDIGGPAMIRAAAKNFKDVGDPHPPVRLPARARRAEGRRRPLGRHEAIPGPQGVRPHRGLRRRHRRLVRRAWPATRCRPPSTSRSSGCRTCATARTRTRPVLATAASAPRRGGTASSSTAGMALSYLNLFDADAAWGLANDLAAITGQPAVAIIKHANPCGAAVADVPGRRLPAGVRVRRALCLRRHRGAVAPRSTTPPSSG